MSDRIRFESLTYIVVCNVMNVISCTSYSCKLQFLLRKDIQRVKLQLHSHPPAGASFRQPHNALTFTLLFTNVSNNILKNDKRTQFVNVCKINKWINGHAVLVELQASGSRGGGQFAGEELWSYVIRLEEYYSDIQYFDGFSAIYSHCWFIM